MRRPRFAVVPLFLAALCARALAQDTTVTAQREDVGPGLTELPPRGFWEGGGVVIGDTLILHPRFELGTAYQTNVFYSKNDSDASGPLVGAGVARATVAATLGTKPPGRLELEGGQGANQAINFNSELVLTWNQFISSNSAVTDQSDLSIGARAGLVVNPQGQLTWGVRDSYTRFVNPGQSLANRLDRDKNELATDLTYKPGGGALQAYFAYLFTADLFEDSRLTFNSRLMHSFELGTRWQWLPITQFSLAASLGIVAPNDESFKPASNPFRVWAGMATLFTPTLGMVLRAGYGNGFYDSGPSVSTYLLLAEFRYAIGPTMRTAAGYSHDFSDALIGNSYVDHQLFARFSLQLGEALQIRVKGDVRFRDYDGIRDIGTIEYCGDAACGKFRKDVIAGVEAAVEYQFTRWLFASVNYSLQTDSTDFFVRSGAQVDPGSFVWQEIGIRVAARY